MINLSISNNYMNFGGLSRAPYGKWKHIHMLVFIHPAILCLFAIAFNPFTWVKKILGVGNGNLLLYSCLENNRTWQATVCGVTKIWTWLRNWEHAHTHTHTHTHTHDLITTFLIVLGSSFVGLFLFLCILPREVSLAFVAKLI